MNNHALALGYFFLAVLCVVASPYTYIELRIPMLVAAAAAVATGVAYVAAPLGARLRGVHSKTQLFIREAQEPPRRTPAAPEEHNA